MKFWITNRYLRKILAKHYGVPEERIEFNFFSDELDAVTVGIEMTSEEKEALLRKENA